MRSFRRVPLAAAAFWLLAVTAPVLGQQAPDQPRPSQPAPPVSPPVPTPTPPPTRPTPETPPEPTPPVVAPAAPRPVTTPEEPFRAPGGLSTPPIFRGPDFFNPPEPRGWITFTPAIAVIGEYNDNLDLTTRGKTSDFIGNIVPGFTLGLQRPNYQLSAGYNFGAEFYAEESERNSIARSQQLFLDYFYQVTPRVTFLLSELFVFDRESNVVSTSGISAGFEDAWRNTLTARLAFQATQRTSLSVSASYSLLRYTDSAETGAQDSDTYRIGAGAAYQFTPRLGGTIDIGAGYLDIERDEDEYNYTALFGLTYQITRTLSGRAGVGPSLTVRDQETTVTPAVVLNLEQTFKFGALGIGYDRSVTAEAIGITDRQNAFATLRLTTLRRELQVELTPYYTHTRNPESSGADRDADTFTFNLRFAYQFARGLSLTGAYIFYRQRGGGDVGDVDQNRVLIGLQYAYPINID
jgi:hypothetical protein